MNSDAAFPDADYAGRIDRIRSVMQTHGVDSLMVSVGADMPYLAGYEAPQLERLTMLIVPGEGEASLLVPRLEAPAVIDRGAFAVHPWDETDDPVAIALRLGGPASTIAVGDHMWSRFLLGLQAQAPTTAFVPATPLTTELRIHKDEAEIGWLREAGQAVDRVAARLGAERFSGRTEKEIAGITAEMAVEEGHDVASFAIVASGPNGASPHHEPTNRVIESGDGVVVDFGGRVRGYFSDTTRNFVAGDPSPAYTEAYAVLREAQAVACDMVTPGVQAQEVDRAARSVIDAAGYGEFFIHRTGHGIGIEVHEEPYIVEGNTRVLSPGMAFSIEPGIYVPGEFGMRIEDIVVVTEDGSERMNLSSRDPYLVE